MQRPKQIISSTNLFFVLFFLNYFLGISICVPPYEWHLASRTMNNVRTFATFIDDLFVNYSKANDKMDTINPYAPYPFPANYSVKQKRAVFNLTFVKCAAELAHFRVINNGKTEFRNSKVVPLDEYLYGFHYYDQSLGHQIAKEFEKEIFCHKKQIAKSVVNQLMQLIFTFAARVQLCVIDIGDIGGWQLGTLLSAYKILSAQNGNNNENGIFPFQIIQIDKNGNHLWAEKMSPNQNLLSNNLEQQQQYIKNFKFILALSEFTLTEYEIYTVLETIMKKTDANEQSSPAIYSFMKDHFSSALAECSKFDNKISETKMHCAFVNFGRMLDSRLAHIGYTDFKVFSLNEKECGKWTHRGDHSLVTIDVHNNTPAMGCSQLEMELFNEPLWNYAHVIRMDVNISKTMLHICDALSKLVHSALDSQQTDPRPKKAELVESVPNSKEYRLFIESIDFSSEEDDDDAKEQSEIFRKCFGYYWKKTLAEKINALNEFVPMLDQLIGEYSRAAACQLSNQMNLFLDEMLTSNLWATSKFGQIFYETLKKHWDNVRYDEMQQLLTFPLSVAEHIIKRLSAFTQRHLASDVQFFAHIDFVKAIHAVASADNNDELESEKRQKSMSSRANVRLFTLLFTLAIRLCWHIEGNEFVEEYVPTFTEINFVKYSRFAYNAFFKHKINVDDGVVQINIPNWHLPYAVYLDNAKELKVKNAKENFYLLQMLPILFSPTLYEVIKMAKILDEMHEDQILIGPSDPEILLAILSHLNKSNEIAEKTKLSVKNQYCFLAHFVWELLAKVKAEKHLPTFEFVGIFVAKTQKLCTEKRIKDDTSKSFGENIVNIGRALQLDSNPSNDLQQILPNLIAELEEMLKNREWNYTILNYVKVVEWNLLEFSLKKSGKGKKWKEIKLLLKKWKGKFIKSFKNANKRPKIQKVVEEIKQKLENLAEEIEESEKEEEKE